MNERAIQSVARQGECRRTSPILSPVSEKGFLEVKSDLRCDRSRRHVVCAAERRQKVVECGFVRYVDRRDLCAPFVLVTVKEVVVADRKIEQVAWRDSLGVVVVILRIWPGHFEVGRPELGRQASERAVELRSDRSGRRWMLRSTEEPGLEFLIGG